MSGNWRKESQKILRPTKTYISNSCRWHRLIKKEEKKLITEGDHHAHLILDANEIKSDLHVLAEEIEQKLVRLEKQSLK